MIGCWPSSNIPRDGCVLSLCHVVLYDVDNKTQFMNLATRPAGGHCWQHHSCFGPHTACSCKGEGRVGLGIETEARDAHPRLALAQPLSAQPFNLTHARRLLPMPTTFTTVAIDHAFNSLSFLPLIRLKIPAVALQSQPSKSTD